MSALGMTGWNQIMPIVESRIVYAPAIGADLFLQDSSRGAFGLNFSFPKPGSGDLFLIRSGVFFTTEMKKKIHQ